MQIVVLYGGDSPERAVSAQSALAVLTALFTTPHRVVAMDVKGQSWLQKGHLKLLKDSDAVLLALHGGAGEDGTVQQMLEDNGIFHYTGSGPQGAALAMNKRLAKEVVKKAGVLVPQGTVFDGKRVPNGMKFPVILKPNYGGSSIGLTRAKRIKDLPPGPFAEPMLLEECLTGREYSVGLLAGKPLPAVEIKPRHGTYDYKHKYQKGATRELCPAPVSKEKAALLAELATTAFHALGLRDFARIDIKENARGVPYFLEANTLPGLTATSLLPLAAKAAGMDMTALCLAMVEPAASRKK